MSALAFAVFNRALSLYLIGFDEVGNPCWGEKTKAITFDTAEAAASQAHLLDIFATEEPLT